MKRPPPSSDNDIGSSGSKRRRRFSTSDDDDSSRPPPIEPAFQSPPLHKIYNSSSRKEKPDELFRKDLISAMKLPDSEQLDESEFWDVTDSWKQEWERGVQVPVNSKNVPNPNVRPIREKTKAVLFKLPKKLMRTTEDSFFSNEYHVLTDTAAKAENICKYDMDDLDFFWLKNFNEKREDSGLSTLDEDTMERIIEDFEMQCSNRFQDALKTEKGLGIEYDEDVICDVCRSPDCEEGNEMVFCDSCNICVHQACYGIMAIPEGSWICRPCSLNIKPPCLLCPNTGGAMKATSSGEKWAHVSCALWIPEVSIGCPEKMEPILKISQIPASRWALICSLCRERVGACIQCSVKQCKVAYHVTCAFENGLEMEMKTTGLDSTEEGVKMQSFCPKHSKTEKSENNVERNQNVKSTSPKKSTRKKKEIKNKDAETEVDEHNARLQRIRSLEAQFHKYVNIKDTADLINIDRQIVDFVYYYWVLKRRAKFNKPLLITKCDEANLLIKQHENLLYSRLKMFVHLRQDLERVRNLCYMVSRREKMFRSFLRIKRDIFEKQNEILSNRSFKLTPKEKEEVLKARVGELLFEKIYCSDPIEEPKDEKDKNVNAKPPNPYAKSYVNSMHTRSRRRTVSQNLADNTNENGDSESSDMPTLVKCKSEEILNSNDTSSKPETPSFTHSPFVIKIESKQGDKEQNTPIKEEIVTPTDDKIFIENLKDSSEIEKQKKSESCDLDMPKINSDNIIVKTKKHICENEISNDKNSLCLSDKENINALNPIKIRKTRSQTDSKHPEFKNSINDLSTPKLELFDDESSLSMTSELNSSDVKRNFRLDRRSTRYQMRSRRCSNDVLEHDELSLKSVDSVDAQVTLPSPIIDSLCSPSSNVEKLTLMPEVNSRTDEVTSLDISPTLTPRRRRGRPRKIIQPEATPDVDFSVIKTEVDSDKNNSFDGILELSDSSEGPGFRMSLRHSREYPLKKPSEQKPKSKRSVIIKLEHPDTKPLKEANKDMADDSGDGRSEHTQSSPEWDPGDMQQPRLNSVEQPASARIIIRLRKDPNRESWKNDSSSSSDVPVAFRIVRNDLDVNCENSVSEFPSIIKDGGSPSSQTYSTRDDNECRHRYSMRERSVVSRNVKCTLERS
ncbi:protein Jade-1-like isoform X1 [Argiope bruennichi]|uniref:protein Jade-1-like isoform X1 n=1 Tax=Argiope bruennichi TaxID=94029 RepID=UPI00249494FE|nr:protein Jade-1-like isoform X1 [Argiope bruennichi]XP_055938844.1 protein Jade-1-like isoform X1 [Argiope bruennichi]